MTDTPLPSRTTRMIARLKSMKHGRRNILLGVVILVLLGWGVYHYLIAPSTTASTLQTQQVERSTIISAVSGSGQVSSSGAVAVSTQVSGIVSDVYVKDGDSIEAGQPIAKITLDQSGQIKHASAWASYQSALSQQESASEAKLSADSAMWSAQKAILDAQNDVDYKNANSINPSTKKDYTDLEKQSIESALIQAQKSFTAAETKYKKADLAIAASQADVASAWLSYQQSSDTIVAPITGTISGLSLQAGSTIASTSTTTTSGTSSTSSNNSSSSGTKIASILTKAAPLLTINASEVDVPKIKPGQRATITLDALSGQTFAGRVISIDKTGVVTSGVTTYPVTINFDSPTEQIYSNMAATANIIVEARDSVLVVPTSAIQTLNGQTTVRVMKNGTMTNVSVETGIASDTDTEITSGLSEGDMIVTSAATTTTGSSTTRSVFGTSPFGVRGVGGIGGGTVRRGQ